MYVTFSNKLWTPIECADLLLEFLKKSCCPAFFKSSTCAFLHESRHSRDVWPHSHLLNHLNEMVYSTIPLWIYMILMNFYVLFLFNPSNSKKVPRAPTICQPKCSGESPARAMFTAFLCFSGECIDRSGVGSNSQRMEGRSWTAVSVVG